MGFHVIPDGALGGRRLPAGDLPRWLSSGVCGAEFVFSLGRDLAASTWDSIFGGRRGGGAARIRLSAMSDAWLRMHETEVGKHRAEP